MFLRKRLAGQLAGGLILGDNTQHPLLGTPNTFECPPAIGNWEYLTVRENQGQTSQCTAYGMCGIMSASWWRHAGYRLDFNEAALYAREKQIDGNNRDGSSLESAIQAAQSVNVAHIRSGYPAPKIPRIEAFGMRSASDLPYYVHRFGLVLLGLMITEGWRSPRQQDGLITGSETPMGGHCVYSCGYDMPNDRIWLPGSWGDDYARDGICCMTFERFRKEWMCGYGLKLNWD